MTHERDYDFTLVVDGVPELTSDVEDALFEAGCSDSTVGFRTGRMFITFSREGASLKDAVISAIKDVRKANVGATVTRVDQCDLVTQAEIARRIGRTRQLVNQYISGERGPGAFHRPHAI